MNAEDKKKDLVFNELTEYPLAADFSEAYQRVTQFLQTYKARSYIFDKRIRLENYIGELQLTNSISLQDFCKNPKGRTVGALLFQKWLDHHQPVFLTESTCEETEKTISLRDDHGKEVLLKFSKRLRKSPYVTEIINSLPFNPKCRDFIKSTYPNGQIEIVLSHTDKGLGVIVQTTGRNIRETEKIAEILKNRFS